MIYMEALKDACLPPTASLWHHRRAIDAYQDLCDTVTRNLESLVRKDWQSKFQESPPLALFRLLSGRSNIAIGHMDPDSFGGGRKRGRGSGRGKDGDNDKQWGVSRGKRKSSSGGRQLPKAGPGKPSQSAVVSAAAVYASSEGVVYGSGSGSGSGHGGGAGAGGAGFRLEKFGAPA